MIPKAGDKFCNPIAGFKDEFSSDRPKDTERDREQTSSSNVIAISLHLGWIGNPLEVAPGARALFAICWGYATLYCTAIIDGISLCKPGLLFPETSFHPNAPFRRKFDFLISTELSLG